MRRAHRLYTEATGERNDCAVRAVAVAFGIPYCDSYARFLAAGREPGKGTPRYMTREVVEDLGGSREHRWEGKTLAQFCREAPSGRYVVSITKHSIAVINGVVHDHEKPIAGPRHRARRVYKV